MPEPSALTGLVSRSTSSSISSQAVLETVSAVRERGFTMRGWEASHFIMWAYISSVLLMWMLAMRYCFTSP